MPDPLDPFDSSSRALIWSAAPPPARPLGRAPLRRFLRAATALWRRLEAADRARRDEECLRRMTDHQLRDVGLRRLETGGRVRIVRLDQDRH